MKRFDEDWFSFVRIESVFDTEFTKVKEGKWFSNTVLRDRNRLRSWGQY